MLLGGNLSWIMPGVFSFEFRCGYYKHPVAQEAVVTPENYLEWLSADTNYGFSYLNYISVCEGFAYLEGKSLLYTTNMEEL